ncbi:membrane fusion protein, Cu(I)/Ag(I) efflux system [Sphingobium faniae]|nr:membrane fusion protein, Cu(I)/Ag(I) efflux system [Sphingobium faniae]
MKTYSPRALIASAIIPVGVLIAILAFQAQRGKWPFASQHQSSEVAGRGQSASGTTEATSTAAARAPVELTAKQVDMLGVQMEAAEVRKLEETVPGVATAVIDESRIVEVHPRVSGWLEQLYVRTTGQNVRAGQALGAVFSQELYASQLEYLAALRRANTAPASVVVAAGRTRLKVLGMGDAEIRQIERTRQANRLVSIVAPRSGFVLDRGATQGITVDPSTNILSIADVTQLWIIVEVAEAGAGRIQVGSPTSLTFPLSGRPPFIAQVEFIYPMLTERTRSIRVRMSVPNIGGALRPGMYGSAQISAAPRNALTIGRDAVVDTGISQHVFIRNGNNRFEPRTIKLGAKVGDRVEVLNGLAAGDHVVSAGVFLIDSESRLRASGATGHGGHGGAPQPAPAGQQKAPPAAAPAQHEHQP